METDWRKGEEASKGGAPSCDSGFCEASAPHDDTLLRYGLGMPSFVEAWAGGGDARRGAVGVADFETSPQSNDSDWESVSPPVL